MAQRIVYIKGNKVELHCTSLLMKLSHLTSKMRTRETKSHRFTFHAITAEYRTDISDAVFGAYEKECDRLNKRAPFPEKSTPETPDSALEDTPGEDLEMEP